MTLSLADLAGADLGEHTATYDDTSVILYALAVGAAPEDLDLVYERDLRTLPTYACALGLWAVEAAGRLGAYDPQRSLHGSQRLVVHKPLPTSGSIVMSGRVANVYDKGKASIVEIEATSEFFTATYNIFLPGQGGWGGARGPSSSTAERPEPTHSTEFQTSLNLAVLYRLTGDRHPVHIDPAVAEANGFDRPILHGLCTLGIAAREIAEQVGAHPADLQELDVRLSAPVLPGQKLHISSASQEGRVYFEGTAGETGVLSGGTATFHTTMKGTNNV
ncbi:acyl dehydratase [Arthrobacter ginsengisoli]|uniref:Acyl dehydratase n=1 Tax=Arthrobacter ginsengisoli TaxID=1356565 RepID=A0ABU1UDR7_9MICC|nr:MaoC/PaaZ C-terminal domain-containing protein [Arthrobacter ginsengisoli]MDR7083352.1 acyl dehydratase [Arthrobacter ginsengisoli]